MNIFGYQFILLVIITADWFIMTINEPEDMKDSVKWVVLISWAWAMLFLIGTIIYGVFWYE